MNTPDKQPTFSIVTTTYDQANTLATNLPTLLSQQYEGYEVIVVDESSTDNSADVLKQLKDNYPHLYSTFLPKYQFQRDRRRLAFTIGLKAAKNEWIVFTDIDTFPSSEQWLMNLSESCRDSVVLQLGFVKKESNDMQLQPFENIDEASSLISQTERWRAGIGSSRWLRFLKKNTNYDFIAVRADYGHELLRLFALDQQTLVP